MKLGLTKTQNKELEKHLGEIEDSIEDLVSFLRDLHEEGEFWAEERSESWQESERGEEFMDWLSIIDDKIDEIETLRDDEFSIDSFQEVIEGV